MYHGAYTILVSNLSGHIDKCVSRDRNMCDMLWCSLEGQAKASQSVSGKIGAAAVIDGREAPKERALPLWNDLPRKGKTYLITTLRTCAREVEEHILWKKDIISD